MQDILSGGAAAGVALFFTHRVFNFGKFLNDPSDTLLIRFRFKDLHEMGEDIVKKFSYKYYLSFANNLHDRQLVHAGKVFLVDQSYSVIGQVSAIRRRVTEFSNQSREEDQRFLSITPRENVKQCECRRLCRSCEL